MTINYKRKGVVKYLAKDPVSLGEHLRGEDLEPEVGNCVGQWRRKNRMSTVKSDPKSFNRTRSGR